MTFKLPIDQILCVMWKVSFVVMNPQRIITRSYHQNINKGISEMLNNSFECNNVPATLELVITSRRDSWEKRREGGIGWIQNRSEVERGFPVGEEIREEVRGRQWRGLGLGGRKCVTSQIRLRNLCMKFTGGLVSVGVGASHVSLRIKYWTEKPISLY